jgi:hypothetical protein
LIGVDAEKFRLTGELSLAEVVVLTGRTNVPPEDPSVITRYAGEHGDAAGNWSCIRVTTMLLSGVNTAAELTPLPMKTDADQS